MRATPAATIRAAHADDHSAVEALLRAADLPVAGVPPSLEGFLVAERGGAIVGAIGLESWHDDGLLRSAVVAADERGAGLGQLLVERLLADARRSGYRAVYLLTTTAESWFPRFGFARVTRDVVPEGVRESVEFRGACPESATVMQLTL